MADTNYHNTNHHSNSTNSKSNFYMQSNHIDDLATQRHEDEANEEPPKAPVRVKNPSSGYTLKSSRHTVQLDNTKYSVPFCTDDQPQPQSINSDSIAASAAAVIAQKSAVKGSIHSVGSAGNLHTTVNNRLASEANEEASQLTRHRSNTESNVVKANISREPFKLPLIDGEKVVRNDKDEFFDIVFVMPDNRGIKGKLFITNFRLYFLSSEAQFPYFNINLPLGLVHRIEKIGHHSSKQINSYGIVISCKNGRRLRFANTQENRSRKPIYETLQRCAFPITYGSIFFAFVHKPTFAEDGWSIFDARSEYERMGILQSKDWRFTDINKNYEFSDTYPSVLVVPKLISDDDLIGVGDFRSKKRIPVLSWTRYDPKLTTKNTAAILRSSQPLCGLTHKRGDKDEHYLNVINQINTFNTLKKTFIVDARPHVNAIANRTTGGGYEGQEQYKKCELVFLNIQNIHVMRESLRKIFEMSLPTIVNTNQPDTLGNVNGISPGNLGQALNNSSTNSQNNSNSANVIISNDEKNFFLDLENSKWLEHIRCVLNGAMKIVKYVHVHRSTVLVHCSDGWDRTSQLTSLAMLMMDKYYRTIRGFEILIEKEWLSFGHRFSLRMGHGTDKHSDQDRSPIFLQFIDCVWQVYQQNTKVFEFNDQFLLTILKSMYTCQYGTFLYNCEREREINEVKSKTTSLWSYINSNIDQFKNPYYTEYDGIVECSASLPSLQLWTDYYFQYKDIIDDRMTNDNLSDLNRADFLGLKTSNQLSLSTYQFASGVSSNKIFGQAFFQQLVSQMKTSMRSNPSSEPELVRYHATVQNTNQF